MGENSTFFQTCIRTWNSPVDQQVKDPVLSLLWHRFYPWPRSFPMAVGAAKTNKQTNKNVSEQDSIVHLITNVYF